MTVGMQPPGEKKPTLQMGSSIQRSLLAFGFQGNCCPPTHLPSEECLGKGFYFHSWEMDTPFPAPCLSPSSATPVLSQSQGRSALAQLLGVSQDAEGDLAQKAGSPGKKYRVDCSQELFLPPSLLF